MGTADQSPDAKASTEAQEAELRSVKLPKCTVIPSPTRTLRIEAMKQGCEDVGLQGDLTVTLRDGRQAEGAQLQPLAEDPPARPIKGDGL